MVHSGPPTEFDGFDEARHLMWCYESRSRILRRIQETGFLDNTHVYAIHIDDAQRSDRAFLLAFDDAGHRLGADTLYVDEYAQRLETTPEFDHRMTGLEIPVGTELAECAAADGWILDVDALRQYDHDQDRRTTQKQSLLAHLRDMAGTGDARVTLFGQSIISGPAQASVS